MLFRSLGDIEPHWMPLSSSGITGIKDIALHTYAIVGYIEQYMSSTFTLVYPNVPRYIPTHPTLPQLILIRCHIHLELETLISLIEQYVQNNARMRQKRQ